LPHQFNARGGDRQHRRRGERTPARSPHRRLPVGAVSLLGIVVAIAVPTAVAATLRIPSQVSPGEAFTLRSTGFAPNEKVSIAITPTLSQGGNGVGVTVPSVRADRSGRVNATRLFPRTYFRCSGSSDCNRYRWQNNERVTIYLNGAETPGVAARARVKTK
jgi:hypothetical protein